MNYFSPETRDERRAAFRAVRDVAAGKSRDEVRALYLAELRSRGISQPPDDYLEIDLTVIINASGHKTEPRAAAHRKPPSPCSPTCSFLLEVSGMPRRSGDNSCSGIGQAITPGSCPPIGQLNRSG